MAMRLIGQRVVLRMPKDETWERFYLVGVDKISDRIWVKRTRLGRVRSLRGVWRVHMGSLFSANSGLPAPLFPAKLPEYSINPRRVSMATGRKVTRRKSAGASSTAPKSTKATGTKKATPAASNGDAPKTRKDKLGHLTEVQRKRAASIIFKMRGDGKPWPEVMEELESKGMPIPGSMTGRRLLRDYHEDGEAVIRERVKTDGAAKKKATSTKAKAKKAAATDDEEEEEEEEPVTQPKRRVRVRRGAGKKSNPS